MNEQWRGEWSLPRSSTYAGQGTRGRSASYVVAGSDPGEGCQADQVRAGGGAFVVLVSLAVTGTTDKTGWTRMVASWPRKSARRHQKETAGAELLGTNHWR